MVLIILTVHTGMMTGARADDAATVEVRADGIIVTPATSAVTYLLLRVADPRGDLISEKSTDGSRITWNPPKGATGGIYTWEVRAGFSARKTSRNETLQTQEQPRPWSQSGAFLVKGGSIIPPSETESSLLDDVFSVATAVLGTVMDLLVSPASADQVIQDNVIVQGKLAVGWDAVNGEDFGFDTIRLKENNLRIHFEDTSSIESFPTRDWRITINDTDQGGASYFAVDDVTGGKRPFTIEAGALNNSLYVDKASYSRIGIGTSTPSILGGIHMAIGNTPTVRFEQDGSDGWPAQTWDVSGHEVMFFIRDMTHTANIPFKIHSNTPEDTLCVGYCSYSGSVTDGRVGIGTKTPQATLDVQGNAFVLGNLEMGSSREYKEDIRALELEEAMDTLRELRPVKFHYTVDPDEESVGFIAEEVPDLVATNSRKSLSTMDVVAVLAKVAQEQQKVIEQLTLKITDLENELKKMPRNTPSGGAL